MVHPIQVISETGEKQALEGKDPRDADERRNSPSLLCKVPQRLVIVARSHALAQRDAQMKLAEG